jgi:hypothetical protein
MAVCTATDLPVAWNEDAPFAVELRGGDPVIS